MNKNLSKNQNNENKSSKFQYKKNNIIPKNKSIPFIIYENYKFKVTDESRKLLNQKGYSKIEIISLIEKYRARKFFLLNKVILNTQSE